MNKTINEYFETHTEPVELAFGTFYSAADGNVRLVMRDGSEITAFDEEDLQDFYEEHAAGEFRICSVCGSPMDAGYMCEGSDFYACSDICLHQDMDERYGVGKWKPTPALTAEEEKMKEVNEFSEDSYHAFLGKDGHWHADDTFYTEWY